MTAMDQAQEPTPEHVKDAVLRAMETKDETILRALSPEDSEAAFRWLTSIQAYEILESRRPVQNGSAREDQVAFGRRPDAQILAAEHEMAERLWYYRALAGSGRTTEDLAVAADKLREVEAKYDNLVTGYPFELGVLHGKLSALRWVLGDEWDMLDT